MSAEARIWSASVVASSKPNFLAAWTLLTPPLDATLTARGTPVAPGPVILFTAVADGAASFYGNLTFVQGHVAFHPEPSNPAQFGVLDGRLGPLAAGQSVLGYAVLPPHVDVALPLDIYWNDRQVTATLSP